ncbi:response regulator [candidate division WWE3 bacterium]|uniref:Response regulator n=1 Tax=candidate division WWE3 bacterium TaxID=2053526 RepID=A0A7X9DK59_UNCKA|nr:response regulator [candidate division WWE3 bacterium]
MPKKILIAEDEKPIRDILETKLQAAGFETICCSDGEECVALINSNKPDLILLDIIMPKKDGLEILKEISKTDWVKNVPIIVLSNKSDYNTQHEAWYYGVKVYLVKAETSLEDVLSRVKQLTMGKK